LRMFLRILLYSLLLLTFSTAQKLSEEDPLEGSANVVSPDDEDFEASGLPPEEDQQEKAQIKHSTAIVGDGEDTAQTEPSWQPTTAEGITVISRRPTTAQTPEAEAFSTAAVVGAIVVAIIVVAVIVIAVVCYRRRSKSDDYTQGTPRNKNYV
jgi:hypothetical protein